LASRTKIHALGLENAGFGLEGLGLDLEGPGLDCKHVSYFPWVFNNEATLHPLESLLKATFSLLYALSNCQHSLSFSYKGERRHFKQENDFLECLDSWLPNPPMVFLYINL
jgi:hypothetical protein